MTNNTSSCCISYNDTGTVAEEYTPSLGVLILAGCIIVPIIFIVISGNILTIVSYAKDKSLHKAYYIIILNIAIADLFIGLIIMPFYLTYTLNSNVWMFGESCRLWMLLDFIATMVTVLLMIILSYDRLIWLKNLPNYLKTQTQKRVMIKCAMAWTLVFLLNGPAIIGWDIWTSIDIVKLSDCDVQYGGNFVYTAGVFFLEFILPFFLLCVINIAVLRCIRKLRSETKHEDPSVNVQLEDTTNSNFQLKSISERVSNRDQSMDTNTTDKTRAIRSYEKQNNETKSLGILVFVLLFTWTPYVIVTMILTLCGDCISVPLYQASVWIQWFKSAINPFLYAWNCERFRENFMHFLCRNKSVYKLRN